MIESKPFKQPAVLLGLLLSSAAMLYLGYSISDRSGHPVPPDQKVANFRMLDHRGRSHELYAHTDAGAIVLFWQGNGCPIVRLSIPKIKELEEKYANRRVRFLLINANPQDDLDSIAKEAEEFLITQPVLKDETQSITVSLGVERTADCILIDPDGWKVVYHGALDDSLGYESQKPAVSHPYLDEAIESLLNKKRMKQNRGVEAKGCLISLPDSKREVSYEKEVAPILRQKCLACHQIGGAAPWAMTDHTRVKGWAPMMREVLLTKRMPPWEVDPRYGRFTQAISISPEESKTLLQWIESGCPRGPGGDPLADSPPPPQTEWSLGKPDIVIPLPEQKIPAAGLLPWRSIRVKTRLGGDKWIRAVQLKPSNKKVLHHATADSGKASPMFNMETDPELDRLAAFIPAIEPHQAPDGTGKFLADGDTIHFILHYVTTGRPEVDRPKLALYFNKSKPSKRLRTAFSNHVSIRIPPRAENFLLKGGPIRFSKDVLLYDLTPHMHYRARSFKATAFYPDGTSEILLSVPNFSFNWQHTYRLAEPKLLPAGTLIEPESVYDNSDKNPLNPDPDQTVTFGFQTTDEMLFLYVSYVEAGASAPSR